MEINDDHLKDKENKKYENNLPIYEHLDNIQ